VLSRNENEKRAKEVKKKKKKKKKPNRIGLNVKGIHITP
jgi:hypothetical protein